MSQGLRLALLGIWAGMLLAIGLVAIPAAFQTLPGTELSARLVGAALPTLDQAGLALAFAAVGLGWVGGAGRTRALLPGLGGAFHLTSLLWLAPRIHQIREAAGGSVGRLGVDNPELELFALLHNGSVALFVAAGVIALATIAWDLLATIRKN
ncbi:MAG: DUF4149 domain-containing protein [Myxococcota bacterium]|nr:DUF4149 domain-containing protein [Myxococcota bacterium]